MAHKTSIMFTAIAFAGIVGCGGSDQNTQPQTPPPPPQTTGAMEPAPAPVTPTMGTGDTSTMGNPSATSPGMNNQGGLATNGSTNGSAMGSGSGASSGMASGGTGDTSSTFTDEQITAVTNAANTGEVDQAKEAVKKAKSGKVKTFAQHMITDHGAAFKQQTDIEKKANITPQDNDTSRQIQSDGRTILSQIQGATGADFDRQYIDAQVKEHQSVLDALDNKLIPAAKNADLKSFLQKTRDKVADHLKMAKDIQSSLK
jgi:putative membrane protein